VPHRSAGQRINQKCRESQARKSTKPCKPQAVHESIHSRTRGARPEYTIFGDHGDHQNKRIKDAYITTPVLRAQARAFPKKPPTKSPAPTHQPWKGGHPADPVEAQALNLLKSNNHRQIGIQTGEHRATINRGHEGHIPGHDQQGISVQRSLIRRISLTTGQRTPRPGPPFSRQRGPHDKPALFNLSSGGTPQQRFHPLLSGMIGESTRHMSHSRSGLFVDLHPKRGLILQICQADSKSARWACSSSVSAKLA